MATADVSLKDVFDILTDDHGKIAQLIGKLRESPPQEKEGLLSQLDAELTQHMDLEEQYLYPELEEVDELNDIIASCQSDHEGIKDLLQKMASVDTGSPEWEEAFEALEDAKEIHVHTEEREVFPRAMKLLDEAQTRNMTEAIILQKQKSPQPVRVRRPPPREPRPGI